MFEEEDRRYIVVANDEEQYSIWPEGRELPKGWRAVREPASRRDCLEHIERVWTDVRPSSLRRAMARSAADGGEPVAGA
ncbi:MAG: MbtH family NRPS accessory protein [Holophagales bacterium]|nr:MbtH family NRPS accessory protein [Holophagales bacterium]